MFTNRKGQIAKIFSIIFISAILWGCEKPAEPLPPSDCEVNKTAFVRFENRLSRYTYDVIWDGVRLGSIGPGKYIDQTVAAGRHSLAFKYTNSNDYATSVAYPNLAQCSCQTYYCN